MKVVLQKDMTDCGICCLQAIIIYYNGYVPLEVIRNDTLTSIKGTDAYHLIMAAKKYGFDAYGEKIMEINDLISVTLPAIVHVVINKNYEHYMVLEKIDNKNVYLMDPAKGHVKMTINDFLEIWSNIVLVLYPNTPILKFQKNKPLFLQLYNLIKMEKKLLINLVIVTFLVTICAISYSLFFKIIIANLMILKIVEINQIITIFAIILMFKIVFDFFRNYYEIYLNKNIDISLKELFVKQIIYLPSYSTKSRQAGEIIARIEELNNYKSLITDFLVSIMLDSIIVIASGIILLMLNKVLFMVLIIMLIIYLIIGLLFNKFINEMINKVINEDTFYNNNLIENITNLESIKHLFIEDKILKHHETLCSSSSYYHFKFEKRMNYLNMIKSIINDFGLLFINVIGIKYIFLDQLTILDLVTFNSILIYFKDPLKNYIDLLPKISFLKNSFNKLSEFFMIPREVFDHEKTSLGKKICFNHVSYAYDNINYIFKDLSFKINSGEKVMLRGRSGKGKSTICKILYGQLDNYDGNILFDNKNAKDCNLTSIRQHIGYLGQNENLFTDTIYNNIVLYRHIDQSLFEAVCEVCEIEDIVKKRKLRYQTMCLEMGKNLSGGERQRILLARILLKQADILILDEALSEVNSDLEQKIIKKLLIYLKDETLIYVTHRPLENNFLKVIEVN